MKTLRTYTLKEITTFFSITLLTFTAVLLTLRMLRFASLIVDKGVEPFQIVKVFIAIIPTFLELALPLATLIGVMTAFARLSGDSEIVVVRGTGISLFQLIPAVLFFGAVVSGAGLYVSQQLKPLGYRSLSETLYLIARSKTTSGLEEGLFNKLGDITLYAEEINDQNGALQGVIIDDRRDPELRRIIAAPQGKIMSNPSARSVDLELYDGEAHEQTDGKYFRTGFKINRLTIPTDQIFSGGENAQALAVNELYEPEIKNTVAYLRDVRANFPENLKEISVENLPKPIPLGIKVEAFTREGINKRIARLEFERLSRYSLPCASILLALLAFPLGIQPARAQKTWGIGLAAALGIIVFLLYYGIFTLGSVLSQSGAVPIWLALWLPNVVTLIVALVLIRQICSERWASIATLFERLAARNPFRKRRLV